jgi:hypothetical protein
VGSMGRRPTGRYELKFLLMRSNQPEAELNGKRTASPSI